MQHLNLEYSSLIKVKLFTYIAMLGCAFKNATLIVQERLIKSLTHQNFEIFEFSFVLPVKRSKLEDKKSFKLE